VVPAPPEALAPAVGTELPGFDVLAGLPPVVPASLELTMVAE
jgi:hypothetical protein